MAPRQRLMPQPSHEELASAAASLQPTKPLLQSSSSTSISSAAAAAAAEDAEAARERHDIFNIVALVRAVVFVAFERRLHAIDTDSFISMQEKRFFLNYTPNNCLLAALLMHSALCCCSNAHQLGL